MHKLQMANAHDIFAIDILYHKKCYSCYLTKARRTRISQDNIKVLN